MKKVLSLVLFAILAMTLSITAFAADIVASGYCGGEGDGTNLTWTLTKDGVLTISGTGRMADYERNFSGEHIEKPAVPFGYEAGEDETGTAPWDFYSGSVKKLVLSEGVTYIGRYAFWRMDIPGELVLPSTMKELALFSLCSNNFTGDLVIPEGVEKIDGSAFQGSGDYGTAYVPASLIDFEYHPFRYCDVENIVVHKDNPNYCAVDGVLFSKDKTVIYQYPQTRTGTYTIPDSVRIIKGGAFESIYLSEIIINSDIDEIGSGAFSFNRNDMKVIFNGKVGTVKNAFTANIANKEVYFAGGAPERVYEKGGIGDGSFSSKMGRTITVYYLAGTEGWEFDENGLWNGYEVYPFGYCGGEGDGTNLMWKIDSEGVLTISGEGKMADYKYSENQEIMWSSTAPWNEYYDQCKKLVLEEGMTSIGSYAFYGMEALEGELIIPKTVEVIKTLAFFENSFDCNITIPGNVKIIETEAFGQWRNNIEGKLVISEGVETVENNAFFDINITSVEISSTISNYEAAFCFCNIEEITIAENNLFYMAEDNVIFTKDKSILVECICTKTGIYTVPKTVEKIRNYAFLNTKLSNIIIPENVKTVDGGAFMRVSSNIYFEGSPEQIGMNAFSPEYGSGFCNVYFISGSPKKVYKAGENSESFSTEINRKVNIHYLSGTEDLWEFDENGLWNGYEVNPFGYCGGEGDGTNLMWKIDSEGVLTISGTGRMKDYGDFGETYSEDAPWVKYKDSIKSLVLEEGITYIGGEAFRQNPMNNYLSGKLVIPESVEEIGTAAFAYGRNFEGNIYISENVTNIGHFAFIEVGAESFTVSQNNKNFASYDGMLCSKDMKKIITCPAGKTGELVIPESVTRIEMMAFRFCEEITGNLVLPEKLEEIGSFAFYGCIGLEGKLDMPKGIKNLNYSLTFAECGINEFYFYDDEPLGVTSTGMPTFDADDTIYYPAGNETWEIVDGKWNGFTAVPWEVPYVFGDVNEDGKVNVLDANLVRRASARLLEFDYAQELAADVDGNGKVNVLDANLIRRYSAKLIDKFPAEG
ncbi:MAG: leucine-rich repeat protein [Oscillospiraceae bacterium]|nr:leucine-rich repeat protein [Oscillospiraceae bacterium]